MIKFDNKEDFFSHTRSEEYLDLFNFNMEVYLDLLDILLGDYRIRIIELGNSSVQHPVRGDALDVYILSPSDHVLRIHLSIWDKQTHMNYMSRSGGEDGGECMRFWREMRDLFDVICPFMCWRSNW